MLNQLQRLVGISNQNVVLTASAALLLSGLLQLATAWLQYQSQNNGNAPPGFMRNGIAKREYSWVGEDFPATLDLAPDEYSLNLGEPVTMVLEDSRHYPADGPDADAEWESIYPGTSEGFIRLGPKRRFFGLSVYHQIHCLDSIRFAMMGRMHPARSVEGREKQKRAVPHAQHCLNYLRQSIMCAADLTLEPEVDPGSQDVEEGLFATHVCRDWSKVHAFVEENERDYQRWLRNGTL